MKKLTGALPATLALLVATQLHAQPSPVAPSEPSAPSASIVLTPTEMRASVSELEAQIRVDTQHVQHLQATARQEKDVVKLSCINDKMIKLKAEANLFDQARMQLFGVIETDGRGTAYQSVSEAAARVRKQREEADGCVGQPEIQGESGNTFTAPPITDDPTVTFPFDDNGAGGSVEPPGYASPYR